MDMVTSRVYADKSRVSRCGGRLEVEEHEKNADVTTDRRVSMCEMSQARQSIHVNRQPERANEHERTVQARCEEREALRRKYCAYVAWEEQQWADIEENACRAIRKNGLARASMQLKGQFLRAFKVSK
mmetsp:Transcript_865/g.1647  ORF Transcript_865/g.1647 Transcript_865/m.1647 type:complete len:128 (-) Transcript_865:75-458(-)|eukprot:CAMPEP_0185855746 /NCGR_PEP_ID=MMETSP1354-20130828/26733_1 /TAXON_ID=708628 /ORGANISM="Erythrolobus madagascarensis, Strain CCMP3276" /LENGTH=127 /DNA_ID=CAMNT_0028557829 /DNA_START=125 /DNA_END=508 /DNA_ORIENTATION=+